MALNAKAMIPSVDSPLLVFCLPFSATAAEREGGQPRVKSVGTLKEEGKHPTEGSKQTDSDRETHGLSRVRSPV